MGPPVVVSQQTQHIITNCQVTQIISKRCSQRLMATRRRNQIIIQ